MKTVNIVFQTHWDREWYYSFEYYRYRLTQVMKRVVDGLTSGEIDYFVLDGQVAALEDFYEIADDSFLQTVKALVREGKIIIGPWYVLADEFLVSGESLIRNLEVGMDIARENGKCQHVGYLPDTFGHISQMPQILKGFNINDAMIWRGIKSKHSELIWEAPDETSVFTIFLPDGYYQPTVDQPKYLELMKTFLNKIEPLANTDELLLTNGGDHLMPALVKIDERIKDLRKNFDYNFEVTNYENFIHKVKEKVNQEDLSVFKGELRNNDIIYVLPNVLSTRSYLKVDNQMIEDQILGYTEPLIALMYKKDEQEPKKYLTETWKLLMQNQPHDSICGCSIDEVHREMETRTLKLKQRLDMIEKGALQHRGLLEYTLHQNQGEIFKDLKSFLVFNPHPYPYTGELKLTLYLRQEIDEILDGFHLKDSDGVLYKPVILNRYTNRSFESPLDYFPEFRNEIYYEFVINVHDFKALSLKSFEIVKGQYENVILRKEHFIENDFIKVTLEGNKINLFDKETNEWYQDINHFYSSLDNGDEYNYSKPVNDYITNAYTIKNLRVEKSSLVQKLMYQVEMTLPKGLNKSRKGPTNEKVINTLDVVMSLFQSDKIVKVKTTIHNQAKDHRLRMTFPTNELLAYSFSDSAFSIEKREVRDEVFECERGYGKEVPVVVDPSLSFVYAAKDLGIVFYHRGLHEYQMKNEGNQTNLEVTLMRSVGWLSRDDFRSRGGGAGPSFETVEAQCIGTYEFEYAFGPKNKSITNHLTDAHFFRKPLKLYKGKLTEEPFNEMISIDNKEIQWSSLRKVNNKVYLRVWNPLNKSVSFNISTNLSFQKLFKVKLNHEVIEEITEHCVIKPHEIMTICFEM